MKTYNIYICGVGGQGIIKTSIVMGEAAMKIGKSVVMSEIHGMAQRGGVVSTELRIGQSHSPLIGDGEADIILAFEPLEALRSIEKISEDGCVVTNTAPIMPFNINASDNPYPKMDTILKELELRSGKMYALNALEIAKEAGHILSLNMVMLGGAAAVPNFPIDRTGLKASMADNLPDKSLEINYNAFDYGFNIVNSK